jgi:hypothetical protein
MKRLGFDLFELGPPYSLRAVLAVRLASAPTTIPFASVRGTWLLSLTLGTTVRDAWCALSLAWLAEPVTAIGSRLNTAIRMPPLHLGDATPVSVARDTGFRDLAPGILAGSSSGKRRLGSC